MKGTSCDRIRRQSLAYHVDIGGRFVEHENLGGLEEGAREGHELLLPGAEGRSAFAELHLEASRVAQDRLRTQRRQPLALEKLVLDGHQLPLLPW